jgi:hypothetical protein
MPLAKKGRTDAYAYTLLGKTDFMVDVFVRIGQSVQAFAAREHIRKIDGSWVVRKPRPEAEH